MGFRAYLRAAFLVVLAWVQPAFAEEIRDYYAEPGVNPFKETLNQSFNEHVDPFSGTLQLKYTDIHLPGNGGMDIDVTRTYTSLQTNDYPTLNINGLGWTMHFGRIVVSESSRDKICNQGIFNLTTADNPSLELPDGGRELLVLSALHTDGALITRSNWIARCVAGSPGMTVTAPDGTRYSMNRFDGFREEPSWLTTRIEDTNGNWIAIDYETSSVGINYISRIRRSEEGTAVSFEYEDMETYGIAVSAIVAGEQRWTYRYQQIPGYSPAYYKQLVQVERPDGEIWQYAYNAKAADPNPADGIPEDGLASFSLNRVIHPRGAQIDYTYQYVNFDPGSPQRTTAIHTKEVSGQAVTSGSWTYTFAPHSVPFADEHGGQLRYDATTVTAPEAIYRYVHAGKDFRAGVPGQTIFVRPSFVGTQVYKETFRRNGELIERTATEWGQRKISNEDFWHGADYRSWWRDDGTYVPVILAEFIARDAEAAGDSYPHARRFEDHDAYGNPRKVIEYSNITDVPGKQTILSYYNDTEKWIIGLPQNELHQKIVGDQVQSLGTIEREYDSHGQLTRILDFGEETLKTYTGQGDVETVQDARGKVTRFLDYKRGTPQVEQLPESVTLHRVINDDGTLHSETNGRGHTTRYTYDSLNRLTAIDYPIGADVSISYDSDLGVSRRTLTRGPYRQIETFDDFGNRIRTERQDVSTGASLVRTMRFDAHGREVFASYPNSAAGPTSIFDALGRLERTTHPDNTFVRYLYNDAQATVTNERGFSTTYLYLVRGLNLQDQDVVSIREPENVSTAIKRDVWGNVLEVFQGERQAGDSIKGYGKTYRYDARRLLVESVERESGSTHFTHDEVGNVREERVNNLPPTTFEYDGLNRRTRVDFADGTPDVVTQYDANGNIEAISKGNTSWLYVYDENDNLRSERLTINHALLPPRVYHLGYTYTEQDVQSSTSYPSGLVVDYAPDAFGRATRAGTYATNITYHPSGQLASYGLSNGVTTNLSLNQRLLTQSISAPGVINLSYGYDAGGNVMQITDGLNAANTVTMNAASYDGLDRLSRATGKWGVASFSYDANGNLLKKEIGAHGMQYRVDAQKRARQVDRYNTTAPSNPTGFVRFEFDQRGNTIARRNLVGGSNFSEINERVFEYDSASHLVHARVTRFDASGNTPLAAISYTYDGLGQRVVEHKQGTYDLRFSVYARSGQLMFEDALVECSTTDYIRLGAMGLARSDDLRAAPTLDSDNDQIPDCMELQLGTNPNDVSDALADADGDGLTNLQEFQAGTSLSRTDTDNDGVSDRDELERDLTNPSQSDTDGDGLADGIEVATPGLDPRSDDSDHDGVNDSWEVRLQTRPTDPSDGMLDSDGDGFSNRQESGAKSDPTLVNVTPPRGSKTWSAHMLGPVVGSPVIGVDRTIYVATENGHVTAFNPDGSRRWVYQIPQSTVYEPTVAPNGTIYVVSQLTGGVQVGAPRSHVRALNADGTQKWVWSTQDYLYTSAAVGEDNRLYVGGMRSAGSSFRLIVSLDSTGGDPIVKQHSGVAITSPPVVGHDGRVYAVENWSKLHSYSKTLDLLWTLQLRDSVDAPLALGDDGTVYVADRAGYVSAVSVSGNLKWESQIGGGAGKSSVVIGTDNRLHVGAFNSRLLSLDAATGAVIWDVSTSGTTFTPTVATNGAIYATTFAGELLAFDSNGVLIWRFDSASRVTSAAVLDRDGTLYFGTRTAELYAVADNGGGPVPSPWPGYRHDSAGTNYRCFHEPSYSVAADGDGDGIQDCAELRYGLNPWDPADGTGDLDGDGLNNREEHQRGTRLDLADTDGDGLTDGIEVLVHHTDPSQSDTDHDAVPDGLEVALNTNPLDSSDGEVDSDNDGFSNRQEAMAGSDPANPASQLADGQIMRDATGGSARLVSVGSNGAIYQITVGVGIAPGKLEALHPDFTTKWSVPVPVYSTFAPTIGLDGTVYVTNNRLGIYAYWPDGTLRWVHRIDTPSLSYGIFNPPAIGSDGTIYYPYTRDTWAGALVRAITPEGQPKQGWTTYALFANTPRIAAAPNGNVAVYDSVNSLSLLGSDGARIWETTAQGIVGGFGGGTVSFGRDGALYVNGEGGLQAIDIANGARRWQRAGTIGQPVIDANNRIIVFCTISSTNICAIDSNGQTVWTEQTGRTYRGTLAIDANNSVIAASDYRLTAFNSDGAVRWTQSLASTGFVFDPNYPVVLGDGTIYLAAANKTALVFTTGRGPANSGWSSRDGDSKNRRNPAELPATQPSPSPSVAITSPTTSSIQMEVNETRAATAVASDASDGVLSADIRWTSSLEGQFATGPTAPLRQLGTGTHTITATVTDSAGLTASSSFVVNKSVIPPVVSLSHPVAQVYDVGQQILFSASAVDQLDGVLTAQIQWSSDRDGALGTGMSFTRNTLSAGTHVITASVTDSSGGVGSASITITVEVRGPDIFVTSPVALQEFELGAAVHFVASAVDAVDGNRTSTLRWSSDRDGLLGTGSPVSVSNLSMGAHVISVTASDAGGVLTTVQRSILVRSVPPIVVIQSPASNSYAAGSQLQFRATAQDSKDGNVAASLQWTSSLDGLLGSGADPINRNNLSVGQHLITASAVDSDGQTGESQVWVYVHSPNNFEPFVEITGPAEGSQHYFNDPVRLSAYSFDDDWDEPPMTIYWSSSRDGELGTGDSLTASSLSVGTHIIKALVADSMGGKAASMISVVVLPLPPNFASVVTIRPPADGSYYKPTDVFPLSATAIDREDGNISDRIEWSSDLNGPLGSGATIYVGGLVAGNHTITASVVDNYGAQASATFRLEIYADGASLHLEELFVHDGILPTWRVVDDGVATPSYWSTSSGRAVESSDTQAGDVSAAALPKPGTYLLHNEGANWLDYRLEATLRSSDDDALGLMFRFVDNDNYYRFSMDRERSYRRLVRKVNGVFTLLWQDSTRYATNTNVNVAITAIGSTLTLSINGSQVYSGTDASHRRGSIALYSWGQSGAMFDNVRVFNLRTTSSNDAPIVSIGSPANNSTVLVGTLVSLNGTALDFEDGAVSHLIGWTSNRDGALGTGAIVNLSSLTVGSHTLTATATDADGAIGSAMVTLNVNEPFNDPPVINVTAPTQDSTFDVGSAVAFAGTATDVQDGTISNGISWTSSRNGLLGTGATLNVSTLSPGAHLITAGISDSGGKSASVIRNVTVIVPGNSQPTLSLSAPLNGAAFQASQTVSMTATASDSEDGNLTSSITWSSSINGALGTGGSVNVGSLTGGIHTITATVNDSMGGMRSATATITVVPAAAVSLRDDFNDNNYTGWSVTNEGTISAPSAWSASTGVLRQTSDIHSSPTTAATVPKPGTFNRWTAGSSWTNYSVTTELTSSDNDTLGVMFRYTNATNYYRFAMDSERAQRRLTKVRNGTWTTLWSDSTAYQLNRTYVLELIANGSTLTVKLDGVQLWSGTDSNALTTGTVAMYSWQNTGARFDNVLVRNLSVPLSSINEPKRGVDRSRANIPMLANMERRPRPQPPRAPPEPLALLSALHSAHRPSGEGVMR